MENSLSQYSSMMISHIFCQTRVSDKNDCIVYSDNFYFIVHIIISLINKYT